MARAARRPPECAGRSARLSRIGQSRRTSGRWQRAAQARCDASPAHSRRRNPRLPHAAAASTTRQCAAPSPVRSSWRLAVWRPAGPRRQTTLRLRSAARGAALRRRRRLSRRGRPVHGRSREETRFTHMRNMHNSVWLPLWFLCSCGGKVLWEANGGGVRWQRHEVGARRAPVARTAPGRASAAAQQQPAAGWRSPRARGGGARRPRTLRRARRSAA